MRERMIYFANSAYCPQWLERLMKNLATLGVTK